MEWRFWARTHPAQLNAFGDDCEAIEPLLSLYGDGMASPAEVRLVEAHLPGCESCRESLAWMQATRRALSGRPVLSPPVDLHARIAEAIAASEAAPLRLRPARTFTTRPAFAAAASLAAVGLFLGYSLTHLPHSGVAVKPAPPVSVATLPTTPPSVAVVPTKPAAPTVAVKQHPSAPQMANRDITSDDTSPSPVIVLRVPAKNTKRPDLVAPPTVTVFVAPRPRVKPVAPRPQTLMAVKSAPTIKHTPAPLPTKAPVEVARNEGAVKTPDVQVLTPRVIPQEPPAPERTVSVMPSKPRVQNVDLISEVRAQIKARAHVPIPQAQISRTVELSLRGAARVTQTFGEDGRAAPIGGIHSPNY